MNPALTNVGTVVGKELFPSREAAEIVLRDLIDARLLTSYEIHEGDEAPKRRVEIIHESLLANWPRLVRWQTQDADAAQLRDQLRQAARTWDEHDRTDDMLWTGAAYREFASWRERYPGGLTDREEAFTGAMTSLAKKRKRWRRIATTAAVVLALVIAAVFASLWRRSVLETRRAEASKLLALGQVQLETGPTEALAYATSSLGLADTYEARIFALRALSAGPPLRVLDLQQTSEAQIWVPTFSPDGRMMALAGPVNDKVLVYGDQGGPPIVLEGHAVSASNPVRCAWSGNGFLVTGHWTEGRVRVWSMPETQPVNTIEFGEPTSWQVGDEYLLAKVERQTAPDEPRPPKLVRWKLPNGESEDLGTVDLRAAGATTGIFSPRGDAWIYSKGHGVYARPLTVSRGMADILLGRHSSDVGYLGLWRRAGGFFSLDRHNGEFILWTTSGDTISPFKRIQEPGIDSIARPVPDPTGRWIIDDSISPAENSRRLWGPSALSGAKPVELRRGAPGLFCYTDFEPRGNWVAGATNQGHEVSFWPLSTTFAVTIDGWESSGFTRDGSWLVATDWNRKLSRDTKVRLWPVPGRNSDDAIDLMLPPQTGVIGHRVVIDPLGERALAVAYSSEVFLLSVHGGAPRNLFGFPPTDKISGAGFSPSGQLVAAASEVSNDQPTLRLWNLETDEIRVFDQPHDPAGKAGEYVVSLSFIDESTLYTSGGNGLIRWNMTDGTFEVIEKAPPGGMLALSTSSDRQTMLTYEIGSSFTRVANNVRFRDLKTGEVRSLSIPGAGWLGLSPDGTVWVSGEPDGTVLVGRIAGGEPHQLLGHTSWVFYPPTISPDMKWIASSDWNYTLRLWPMPDLSKPPLHTLPYNQLIAKLKTLTNVRVVRDEESATGWKLTVGPFPGWETVPTW